MDSRLPQVHTASVTMDDIAAACGVHRSTVQRAIAGSPRVRPTTAARILAVAAQMNYTPERHQPARRLAHQRHGTAMLNRVLGLFLPPEFTRVPYFQALFRGITDRAAQEGFDLLCVTNPYTLVKSPSHAVPPGLLRGEVDGALFVFSTDEIPMVVQRLREEAAFGERPLVCLLEPAAGCSAVFADDFGGACAAAGHLLDLGHRHLLHFYRPWNYHSQQRIAGYQQACLQRGLDPAVHLRSAPTVLGEADALRPDRLLQAIRENPEVTALLAPNDLMACEMAEILRAEGIRIPQDLSLVSFDDAQPLLNERNENILTTVRVPLEEIGREAAGLLIQRATGQVTTDRSVLLPVSLIVRASTLPVSGRR